MWHFLRSGDRPRRRGAAAIFAMVMMVVLIGFAALTVDVGVLYNTRADLQNAADAAALAGAAAYATPAMVQVRLGKNVGENLQIVLATAASQAQLTASKNGSFAGGGTAIEPDDIGTGWIDVTSATSPLDPNPTPANYNAVQVVVRRSKDSSNGPVRFFFAPIFGKHTTSVTASAVAAYDDHFGAFDVAIPGAANLWPFTISTEQYDNWVAGSTDNYQYNPETD
ncbi:MAG: pilus assembly protein TadG-related protein, partial [Phycisphaerales bacterium]|nr:pilus assembly protein TadG-related protein [Phycisphaerales bacterium]